MARRPRRSRGKGNTKGIVGWGIAAALLATVVLMSFPSGGGGEAAEQNVDTSTCRDGLDRIIDGLQGDALHCIQELLGLESGVGDDRNFWFTYDGTAWDFRTEGFSLDLPGSDTEQYSAESFVAGPVAFDVIVKNADDVIVFTSSLTRDAASGVLNVGIIDLPGADTVEIHDAAGGVHKFEVA